MKLFLYAHVDDGWYKERSANIGGIKQFHTFPSFLIHLLFEAEANIKRFEKKVNEFKED
jgi:hypothetical protein